MKNLLIIIAVFLCGSTVFAQVPERVMVSGTIQMPPEDNHDGISVFNANTKEGTVTDNDGEFEIAVGLNDSLRISSVQFRPFTVVIDQGIVNSGQINISVNEVVNLLPEVIVNPYDLSGNVRVDVVRLQVVELPDTLTAAEVADPYANVVTSPRNEAMAESDNIPRLVNGLNFVNLFKELLVRTRTDQVQQSDANIDEQVRLLISDEFFKEYVDIEEEKIPEFIFYADDMGLDEQMLKEGNELDLIDFLIQQGKKFKRQTR